jgi:hypothetical protein
MTLTPKALLTALCRCIAALALMHCGLLLAIALGAPANVVDTVRFIDLNREQNLPTYYASFQLLLASGLLLLRHQHAKQNDHTAARGWAGLAAIMLFLSIDEFCALHEELSDYVHAVLKQPWVPEFAWVIPYTLGAIGVAAVYIGFWRRLPPVTRRLFILAAGIFVAGAIGAELVGSKLYIRFGPQSAIYGIETLLEEVLEMVGVALFIYATADNLAKLTGGTQIALREKS